MTERQAAAARKAAQAQTAREQHMRDSERKAAKVYEAERKGAQ